MRGRAGGIPGGGGARTAGDPGPRGGDSCTLSDLHAAIVSCRACPRLVRHRESVARLRRRAFRAEEYWGKPIPGFGDPRASLVLIGLAPAAHGGNRTGRMFTGDRSGDFLYAALHRTGFASQPHATSRDDGLTLHGCYITAAVRCAPPQNRPSPAEIARCAAFLRREVALLPGMRVVVCLGGLAFRAALDLLRERGGALPRPLPRFGHGVEVAVPGITLLGCYHPSQQNTFTGRLTAEMIDRVLERARRLLEAGAGR